MRRKSTLFVFPLMAIGLVLCNRSSAVRPDGSSRLPRAGNGAETAPAETAVSRPVVALRRAALPITAVTAETGRFALRDGAVRASFSDQGLSLSLMNGAGKGVASSLSWNLVGASPVEPRPERETGARVNTLVGDRSEWSVNQRGYSQVAYDQIRPGIDLVIEARPHGVKYTLTAAPGVSRSIPIRYEGAREIRTDGAALEILTARGSLREEGLVCYQEGPGGRRAVPARYVVTGPDAYSIELADADPTLPVVIDPLIAWSTYLGGADGPIDEEARGVAVDGAGNAYVGGWTGASTFPTTPGSFQPTITNWPEAFVAKFSPSGALVWATYLGGGGGDAIRGIAVDGLGQVVVTGFTGSSNFPLVNPWSSTFGGFQEAFVAQLSADGSSLLWSTFIGGSGADAGTGVAIDGSGNVVISGYTTSADFPVTPGSPAYGGGFSDAFVAKFSAGGASLVWATYVGGGGQDSAEGVAVNAFGDVFITGSTDSADFPVTGHGYQRVNRGFTDAFVVKFFADGTLDWSTYLGGSGSDYGQAIVVDPLGNPCITGSTSSSDMFPLYIGGIQNTMAGGPDAFVVKMTSYGASLEWATYLGGSSSDFGYGIAVDAGGNVVVTGLTYGSGFPTLESPQNTSAGQYDVFAARIRHNGLDFGLDWSVIIGGSAEDVGYAVALAPDGMPIVVGSTKSPDFPAVNAFAGSLGGSSDAFVLRLKPTPPLPSGLAQARVDGTPIGVGTWAPGSVVLSAVVGGNQEARIEVELKANDAPFNGVPTAQSAPTPAGATASIQFDGLVTGKSYQWRARQVGAAGTSGWVSFGGNLENPPLQFGDPDFGVDATPPTVQITSPKKDSKNTGQSTVRLKGTSGDNMSVTWVYCTNLTSGVAAPTEPTWGPQGVTSWEVTVPLIKGVNVIQVRAVDHVGNEAIDTIRVTRS
jgi:hypothetical protein